MEQLSLITSTATQAADARPRTRRLTAFTLSALAHCLLLFLIAGRTAGIFEPGIPAPPAIPKPQEAVRYISLLYEPPASEAEKKAVSAMGNTDRSQQKRGTGKRERGSRMVLSISDDLDRGMIEVLRSYAGMIGVGSNHDPNLLIAVYSFAGKELRKEFGPRRRDDFFAVRIVNPAFYPELASVRGPEDLDLMVYALFPDSFKSRLDQEIKRENGLSVGVVSLAFDRNVQLGFRIAGIHQ